MIGLHYSFAPASREPRSIANAPQGGAPALASAPAPHYRTPGAQTPRGGTTMEDSHEHIEHAEHAEHAAHSGDPFMSLVAVTIAILAVIAATVGSLETIESGSATGDKNQAILTQNQATDAWGYFQAKSIKKNMYEIAAGSAGANKDDFDKAAAKNASESEEAMKQAKEFEAQSKESLESSERHEHRHHVLTVGVTLLHVSMAIGAIAIIMKSQRWPWYVSLVLAALGIVTSAWAYVG
jgi:hypothetical protein